jgi:RNA polymerase sigma-70 factor, ECF subfamily
MAMGPRPPAERSTGRPDDGPAASTRPQAAGAPTLESLLAPVLDHAYAAALRLTRNRADAEDLVSEAVLHALRGFHTFAPGSPFKPWFFTVLINAYHARHRKREHQTMTVELEDVPDLYLYTQTGAADLIGEARDPAAEFMAAIAIEQVEAAIDALPEEYRVVAMLYFLQDLGYAEIAAQLGVPIGTVRSRLHRARKMLQRVLWRLAEDSGLVPRAAPSRPPAGGAP